MLRRIIEFTVSLVLISLWLLTIASGKDRTPSNSGGLKPECSHIEILDPDTKNVLDKVPKDLRYLNHLGDKKFSNLHKIKPNQSRLIITALNTLPKFVCSAVTMVAVYSNLPPKTKIGIHKEAVIVEGRILPDDADAFVLDSYPSLINILLHSMPESKLVPENGENSPSYTANWPIAISRIIHEAYHCAAHLLDMNEHHAILNNLPGERDGPKYWNESVNKKAKKIMLKARIDKEGFTEQWTKLHRETIKKTKGPDYQKVDDDDELEEGEKNIIADRKAAPALGFFTYYAQSRPGEDIAETASWVVGDSVIFKAEYMDPNHDFTPPSEVGSWKRPCKIAKDNLKGGIIEKQAALYAKLEFLVDVELISERDLKNCIGTSTKGINKALDGLKTGFHFFKYENGQYVKSYTEDFSITRTSEGYLRIKAKGKINKEGRQLDSFLEMQFRTEDRKLPRGFYKMTWAGNQQNPGAKFAICNHLFPLQIPPDADFAYSQQVPENKSQSYCAIEARVLVTNATEDHIELSMILFKVARTTPIRKVPGVFDPPIQIIVRWKRNWNDEEPEGPLVSKVYVRQDALAGR